MEVLVTQSEDRVWIIPDMGISTASTARFNFGLQKNFCIQKLEYNREDVNYFI